MEKLKKARTPIRGLITKVINEVDAELAKEVRNSIELKAKYERLNDLQTRIQEVDQSIFNEMLNDDKLTEDQQLNESIYCEDIVTRIVITKLKIDKEIFEKERDEQRSNDDRVSLIGSRVVQKRQFKLPKIELKKFSGKILDWLSWWAQFNKIHEDEELHATDKFQYLIQSMEPNTKGADIVKGFPATEVNYPKAIQALQDRFGRKKLLIQVYIRELLKMSLETMTSKPNISTMYDKLVCHIRALDSLNVTVEQASLFLYPMVEASLPEDVLVAWQRSAKYEQDGTADDPPKSELDFLLEFLQQEVEREEQRALVKPGSNNNKVTYKKAETSVPTAAALHTSGSKMNCVFCDKQHLSQDCSAAMKMSNDQRWECIKRKSVCGKCLLSGHKSFQCKAKFSCPSCSRRHQKIMCTQSLNNNDRSQGALVVNSGSNNILNLQSTVILKTIILQVETANGIITVRAFLDDGSQRSYISTKLAMKINGKLLGKYFERNTLFGGVMSNIEERCLYEVNLRGRDEKIFKLELASKDVLTGAIEKLPTGPWMDELKALNIHICDCESSVEDIDILLGADLLTKLTLDKSVLLECGLRAIDTVFGWTVMGPITQDVHLNNTMRMTVSSLNESSITQLWELETIGICDPFEVKAKDERDRQVKEAFMKHLVYTDTEKYVAGLPWVDGIQSIPDNFNIAKKRLINATKTLKQKGMYDVYDSLFQQWEQEGFIEEVKDVTFGQCHYIPHHPVYKPSS